MKPESLNTIYPGANLCLGKDITESKMRQYVNQMYNCGIRLIRMYPYWAHIEETEGQYRLEAYDACFNDCKKYNSPLLLDKNLTGGGCFLYFVGFILLHIFGRGDPCFFFENTTEMIRI